MSQHSPQLVHSASSSAVAFSAPSSPQHTRPNTADSTARSDADTSSSEADTSDPEADTPDPRPTRRTHHSYTDAQKTILRARWHSDPKPTRQQLCDWFFEHHGVPISKATLSRILKAERADLDSEAAAHSQARRQRSKRFPELEEAMYREYRHMADRGETVTSKLLQEIGRTLWGEMEIYRGRPMPSLCGRWIASFRARHGIPVRGKRKSDAQHGPARPAPPFIHPSWSKFHSPNPPVPTARHPPSPYTPQPAYSAKEGSLLHVDRKLYTRIAATAYARPSSGRILVAKHVVPPRSGLAWSVPAGHIVRITTPSGPQVGDLNLWNLHDPRERFWAARTRQLHASHVRVFDRLWSCLPYLRPMVTVTADSLAGYGADEHGGRCHDLLGTRCDPYVRKMLTTGEGREGDEFDFHCHSNLTRAVMPWGLSESDVHDVLNVFQVTGLDPSGRYFMAPSPAVGTDGRDTVARPDGSPAQHPSQQGADYLEFFAEIDILCALSACPGGDLSCWEWSDEQAMRETCRPLGVEVYRIVDAAAPQVLAGWKRPPKSDYKGRHGIVIPHGEGIACAPAL